MTWNNFSSREPRDNVMTQFCYILPLAFKTVLNGCPDTKIHVRGERSGYAANSR